MSSLKSAEAEDQHIQHAQHAETIEISPFMDALIRLCAAGSASAIAEICTLPADVIKTRLQVQNFAHSTTNNQMYNGMIDASISIYRHEGIPGLFKGLQPALIRQVSYTGLAFVVFEPIRDAISSVSSLSPSSSSLNNNNEPGFFTRVIAGGTAGAFGISIMNPTEVLKTQMQTNQSVSTKSLSMTQIIKNIYRNEGIFGFWAGVKPNIARAFLVNAAEIGTYDHAKHSIIHEYKLLNDGMLAHISASFIAGVTSALVSTPVDVVKTRFMNQAGQNKEYNKGMFGTLISIPKQEGFFALYKGFYPIICRKVVWCTMFFVSYEKVRAFMGLPDNKK